MPSLRTILGWGALILVLLYIVHHPQSGAALGNAIGGLFHWITNLFGGATASTGS